MGRVTVLISTTPDGFADSQNVIIDEEFFAFTQSLIANASAIIFGRTTFELFQDRWPQRLQDPASPTWVKEMAQTLHDMHKVVFSTTLQTTSWNKSSIVQTIDADYIRSFKQPGSKGLITFGSLSVVETLIDMNLVDDYYFNLQPLIPGKGQGRFFNTREIRSAVPLKYIDCLPMRSGAHIIHYQNEQQTLTEQL